jgi:hypothetical protein
MNEKKMVKVKIDKKQLVGILIIIIISFVIMLMLISFPYFLNFKGSELSKNTQDWGAFGSYIAGVTSVINLIIFIILTVYIARLGDTNSERQISTQKKIMISQFRQSEIEKLSKHLDKAYDFSGNETKGELINIYVYTSKYLTDFINQKKYLFPILNESEIENKVKILLKRYSQLVDIVDELYGKTESEIEPWKHDKLSTKIQFTIFIKNELIEKLQAFVLNDIEK